MRLRAFGIVLGAMLAMGLAGCGPSPSSGAESPPRVQGLPSMGGRGLAVGVSPLAGDEGIEWIRRSASMLSFTPLVSSDGWTVEKWQAALLERRMEVVWVRLSEAQSLDEGLETGEAVLSVQGESLVPVMRAGSKWRGALNAAAKVAKEAPR